MNSSNGMAARELIREFCSKSTIHGVRYFTERRLHWSERIWWVTAFTLSVCICGASIHNIWQKWLESPIVMGFHEKESSVGTIPFPMVTVCPITKFYKHKFDVAAVFRSFKQSAGNLTDTELVKMRALSHICPFPEFGHIDLGDDVTNQSIYDVIQDLAPSLNDTIRECSWQDENIPCSEIFTPVMTEDGHCFAFNALNSHELYTDEMTSELMILTTNPNITNWSYSEGYASKEPQDDFPFRVFNARPGAGLSFSPLIHERDVEYMCHEDVQGFQIFIKLSGETIEMSRKPIRVPFSEVTDILIQPTHIQTSERLRSYSAKQRQCFFQSDRKLRFFKTYNRNNCEAECIANFTMKECNCVKFSMPREEGANICGTARMECYRMAKKKLFGEDVIYGLRDELARKFRKECNCLPSCTSISYDSDMDRANFDWRARILSYNYSSEYLGFKPSYVRVYFDDFRLRIYLRSEKYTITNILSMWGGLCGLFLGVSALSIVEFIYYSTFRLFWTLREHKRKDIVEPFVRDTIPTQRNAGQYSNRANSIAQTLSEISAQ